MAIETTKTSIQLDQDDREFINYLKNRVNSFGQLPYNLNEQMAIELIKESAKYFYQWYTRAVVQNLWGLIERKEIERYLTNNGSKPFKNIATFTVKLPPAVESVLDVFERSKMIKAGNTLPTGSLQDSVQISSSYYYNSSSYGTNLIGINNHLYIAETVCKLETNNVYESCCSAMISYSFNRFTKDLTINSDITKDIIIRYDQDIPLKYLYTDDLFKRYVLAKCYREMRRIVGAHTIELPGGATVNIDELYNYDDIERVEELIKAGSGIGDIIIWRQ